jgi:hypothetical protein
MARGAPLRPFGPYLDHPNRQRNVRRRFKRRARVAHSARVGSHGRSAGRNILLPPQSITLHYPSHDSSSTSPGLAPLTKYIYLVGVRRNYRAGYFFGFVCGSAYCVGSVYFIQWSVLVCAYGFTYAYPERREGHLPDSGPPWAALGSPCLS